MTKSPTERTLKALRDAGRFATVVEYYDFRARCSHDLLGFADILALDLAEGLTVLVQCTDYSNFAARKKKIWAAETARVWLAIPSNRIEVWAWKTIKPTGKQTARGITQFEPKVHHVRVDELAPPP